MGSVSRPARAAYRLGQIAQVLLDAGSGPRLKTGAGWTLMQSCDGIPGWMPYQGGYQCLSVAAYNPALKFAPTYSSTFLTARFAVPYFEGTVLFSEWWARSGLGRPPRHMPNEAFQPFEYPWWDPLAVPRFAPYPNLRPWPLSVPRPWPRYNPARSPTESPFRDYDRPPHVGRQPTVKAPPVPPIQWAPPGIKPPPPPPQGPRPPPRGHKEKKLTAPALLGFVGRIFSGLTEYGDAVQALWEALPEEFQTQRSIRGMSEDVFNHFDQINWTEALRNLLVEAVEDQVFGWGFGQWQSTPVGGGDGNAPGRPLPLGPR